MQFFCCRLNITRFASAYTLTKVGHYNGTLLINSLNYDHHTTVDVIPSAVDASHSTVHEHFLLVVLMLLRVDCVGQRPGAARGGGWHRVHAGGRRVRRL